MGRWPARVYGEGAEPDPRFTFANERTFLAWIRTSLSLIAAGTALQVFVEEFPEPLRRGAAAFLIVVGVICAAGSFGRWMASERALRLGAPLPAPRLASALAYGIAAVGLLLAVLVLVQA